MLSSYPFKINSQTFLSILLIEVTFFRFFVVLGFGVFIFVFANCYDIMTGDRFSLQITTGSHYSIVVTIFLREGYFTCSGES